MPAKSTFEASLKPLFRQFHEGILGSSSPENSYMVYTLYPSGDMLHLLHKKGRRFDHLATSTLSRKEQEDGPNSRARHQLGEHSARLARRFGGGLDLKQHSQRHSRRTLCGLRGQERHHGGRDFWSDRRAADAAHSLLPGGLCCRAHGKPLRSQARAVGGVASFSGNDRTGAHWGSGGCKFHRPAWGRHTARSGREGCAECPAARVDYDPLGLWPPRPVVPVHRRSTWGCTWGQSRTRAPLSTLKKGQPRFGSRAETLAALGPSYPYQRKLAEAGSLPAPKELTIPPHGAAGEPLVPTLLVSRTLSQWVRPSHRPCAARRPSPLCRGRRFGLQNRTLGLQPAPPRLARSTTYWRSAAPLCPAE